MWVERGQRGRSKDSGEEVCCKGELSNGMESDLGTEEVVVVCAPVYVYFFLNRRLFMLMTLI